MIRRYAVTAAGERHSVELEDLPDGEVRVVLDGRERRLRAVSSRSHGCEGLVGSGEPPGRGVGAGAPTGFPHPIWLEGTRVVEAFVDVAGSRTVVALRGIEVPVEVARAAAGTEVAPAARARSGGPIVLRAPIPGRVTRILAHAGDSIAAGAGIVVLDAMKMENEIRAPRAGRVAAISCREGQAVEADQVLATLE